VLPHFINSLKLSKLSTLKLNSMQLMKFTTLAILLAVSAVLVSAVPSSVPKDAHLERRSSGENVVQHAVEEACEGFKAASPAIWSPTDTQDCLNEAGKIVIDAIDKNTCPGEEGKKECLVVTIAKKRDEAISAFTTEHQNLVARGLVEIWCPTSNWGCWTINGADICETSYASAKCDMR
jgi:hypothetical protein